MSDRACLLHGTPNGFVWTFVPPDEHGETDVAYIHTGDRSGETPKRLLGGTKGTLIVDAYSGYNVVAEVSRRKRAPATHTCGGTSTRRCRPRRSLSRRSS